jgi:hypothetical protein
LFKVGVHDLYLQRAELPQLYGLMVIRVTPQPFFGVAGNVAALGDQPLEATLEIQPVAWHVADHRHDHSEAGCQLVYSKNSVQHRLDMRFAQLLANQVTHPVGTTDQADERTLILETCDLDQVA